MTLSTLSKPDVILFDWDNTLVDSWPVIFETFNTTHEAMGKEGWSMEKIKREIGRSLRDVFPVLYGDKWEDAMKVYYQCFESIHMDRLRPYAGAEACLTQARQLADTVMLISNKTARYLREEVDALGWTHYFDQVMGAGDAARDKPHPSQTLTAFQRLEREIPTPPLGETVWFIGDSKVDMAAAEQLGCSFVLFKDGEAKKEDGFTGAIHAQVKDLAELTDLFCKYDV